MNARRPDKEGRHECSAAGKCPSGSVPILSRSLTVQAADVAVEAAAFARASLEAHRVYLEAGRRLVVARGACRPGEWGRYLEAAGLKPRAAADMMMLSKRACLPSG